MSFWQRIKQLLADELEEESKQEVEHGAGDLQGKEG